MSKHLPTPVSRLICLGGGRLGTNAGFIGDQEGQPDDGLPV